SERPCEPPRARTLLPVQTLEEPWVSNPCQERLLHQPPHPRRIYRMLETTIRPADSLMDELVVGAQVRTERAAQRARVEAGEIERQPFDLSVLEDEGMFVNVDARGFGLLDRRLDWQ